MKTPGSIPLLLAGSLLFFVCCKTKHQTVHAVEKKVVKHKPQPKAPDNVTPAESKDGYTILQEKLGLSAREVKHDKLYAFIGEWYGIPYKYGGCQKSGVDCSCFVNVLYDNVYSLNVGRTAGDMFVQCDKIAGNEAREGDLVFFKINSDKITHVGVYTRKDFFAHASTSRGVVLSNLNEAYYKKYFFCAGRIKKT